MKMQYEYEPSQQQRAIIEEPRLDIPLKVVAGAGSGKTFVLAHRFVWLVVSGKVPEADRILALTFTNNAAAEMKMRIKRLLRLNGHAVSGQLWVHTFHSFAARLLRECSYQVGISPEFQLLTEIRQQVELDRVIDGIFAGDFAQNRA
ncbi:MAG: UvrD-helicase domain-containing protein, partial [Armatimonadetes bacterium]|nr:UvrD-helicase domain-containing protein [Armatimonadota bacterium]